MAIISLSKGVISLLIRTFPYLKQVQIWLLNGEKNDPIVVKKLEDIYEECKACNYAVIEFISGRADIYQTTSSLLVYNKNAEKNKPRDNRKDIENCR